MEEEDESAGEGEVESVEEVKSVEEVEDRSDGEGEVEMESRSVEEEEEDNETKSSDEQETSGDEFPSPQKSAKQHFSTTSFKSPRHQWLCGFVSYLGLPDAGYKKMANRLQHASQVQNILNSIDPAGNDIQCLVDDHGDAVWKR